MFGDGDTGILIFTGSDSTLNSNIVNNTIYSIGVGIALKKFTSSAGHLVKLHNNLITNTAVVLEQRTNASTISSQSNNLIYNNASLGDYSIGAGDIQSDPLLDNNGRLQAASPAIGAGSFWGLIELQNSILGIMDADGTLRSKSGLLDIGAYEYGDLNFTHVDSEIGSSSTFTEPGLFDSLDKNFHVTNVFDVDGLGSEINDNSIGVVYDDGSNAWKVFNVSGETIVDNTAFNIFRSDSTSNTSKVVNTSTGSTVPINVFTSSDLFLHVTQNWNGSNVGHINRHPHAIRHNGIKWEIFNLNGQSIPNQARFNVYNQYPSRSAWEHVASIGNYLPISNTVTVIDHPDLNGLPCARLQVTQKQGKNGSDNSSPVLLKYYDDVKKWGIANTDQITTLPTGAAFNVSFNPAQTENCDLIYENGFE